MLHAKHLISPLAIILLFLPGCTPDDDLQDMFDPDQDGLFNERLAGKIELQLFDANGNDAAYDGTKWVMVGEDIYISYDNINWEGLKVNLSGNYRRIFWANNQFLVLGSREILISNDGFTWSSVYNSGNKPLGDAVWSGTHFIILSDYGIFRSADGISWEFLDDAPDMSHISQGNDRLIGVQTYSNDVYISLDHGLTWTEGNEAGTYFSGQGDLVFANGTFYLFSGLRLYTSTYGITWEETEAEIIVQHPLYHNGNFYGTRQIASPGSPSLNQGQILKSADGLNWNVMYEGAHGLLDNIVVTDNGFLAMGEDVLYSLDGDDWYLRVPRFENHFDRVRWSNGRGIFAGFGSTFLVTEDTKSYELLGISANNNGINAAAWNGQSYLLVGNDGLVLSTVDGNSFTAYSVPTVESLLDIVSTNVGTVAVGSNGTILFSLDGTSWQDRSIAQNVDFNRVEFLGSAFFAVSDEGIYRSPNGILWEQIQVQPDEMYQPDLEDITFNGTTYVAITDHQYGQIFVSTNAFDWTELSNEDLGINDRIEAIEFTGKEFVVLTDGITAPNRLIASVDGLTWSTVFEFPDDANRVADFAWNGEDFLLTGSFKSPIYIARVDD